MRAAPLLLLGILGLAASLALILPKSDTTWYQSVVLVACDGQGYGTGWWVAPGYVVTAFHVVEGCSNITLLRAPYHSRAIVRQFDPIADLAVLEASVVPSNVEPIPLAPEIYAGQEIVVVGYPVELYYEVNKDLVELSRYPRISDGIITWLNLDGRTAEFSAPTDAGNSGGPVIDKRSGGVVGIVVYARPGVVSTGYYVLRADVIAQHLDEWGIPYRVAGETWAHRALLYSGVLGAFVVLGFILARR